MLKIYSSIYPSIYNIYLSILSINRSVGLSIYSINLSQNSYLSNIYQYPLSYPSTYLAVCIPIGFYPTIHLSQLLTVVINYKELVLHKKFSVYRDRFTGKWEANWKIGVRQKGKTKQIQRVKVL